MHRPASNSLIDWIAAATEDMADNLSRLNDTLDKRETDPYWGRRVWRESLGLFSLRRWAFLLPGGGALRGGRPPVITSKPTIPPAVEEME